jgi:hypothetical protein
MTYERGRRRAGLNAPPSWPRSSCFPDCRIGLGGVSAQAGWWLVVVGLIGLALVTIELRRR